MYNGISLHDQQQLFQDSLLFYDGCLVKVKSIHEDQTYRLFDLKTQRTKAQKVDLDKFAPPMKRLGMVNIGGGVFYANRLPMRQYHIGLTYANTKFKEVSNNFLDGHERSLIKLRSFEAIELHDSLMNKYPTLKECIQEIKLTGGVMAFDKQFAIDYAFKIWYKTKIVGSLPKNCSTVQRIVFEEPYSHLSLLLDGNCEKDLREIASPIA